MLISDMTASDKPTRSVTLQQVADFAAASGVTGVAQIIAGDNVTISSTGGSGTGIVTINAEVDDQVTYSYENTATLDGGARLALIGSDGSVSDINVNAGENISITDNSTSGFTINSEPTCWTLGAGVIEDNVVLTLSDGEEGCPDSTITLVAGENMEISRVNNVITFASSGGSSSGMTSWDIRADNGSTFAVGDQELLDITGGVDLTTSVGTSGVDRILTINHDTFGTAGTYSNISSITTNSTGHVVGVSTSGETKGFTPIDIAIGNEVVRSQVEGTAINTYWFQTISSATFVLNKAKIFIVNTLNNGFGFSIYEGDFSGADLFAASQQVTSASSGIYEFTIQAFNQANKITLGENYIIALSLPQSEAIEEVLGIAPRFESTGLARTTAVDYSTTPFPTNIDAAFFEGSDLTSRRPCCHLY